MKISKSILVVGVVALVLFGGTGHFVLTTKEEVVKIKDEIDAKKDRIEEIRKAAEKYREEIRKREAEQSTLQNEIGILENRVSATELDIQAIQEEINTTLQQISLLEREISDRTEEIKAKKELVARLIRNIRESDKVSYLEVLLTNDTFSEFFDQVERLQGVESRTLEAVQSLKDMREDLILKKSKADSKQVALDNQRDELSKLKENLLTEQVGKNELITQSAMSEQKFQAMLQDIKNEQDAETNSVKKLETSLKDLLAKNNDTPGATAILTWPLNSRIITTYFHDPSYPFRRLFPHTGLDVATGHGTPVKAAAPGYVATVTTGRLYGNYITIVHSGGVSTLYAHLSKQVVKSGTYVERGQVIGYSGGTPGTQGAGLSTGPHLHFESRVDGVPANPLNYLVETK